MKSKRTWIWSREGAGGEPGHPEGDATEFRLWRQALAARQPERLELDRTADRALQLLNDQESAADAPLTQRARPDRTPGRRTATSRDARADSLRHRVASSARRLSLATAGASLLFLLGVLLLPTGPRGGVSITSHLDEGFSSHAIRYRMAGGLELPLTAFPSKKIPGGAVASAGIASDAPLCALN